MAVESPVINESILSQFTKDIEIGMSIEDALTTYDLSDLIEIFLRLRLSDSEEYQKACTVINSNFNFRKTKKRMVLKAINHVNTNSICTNCAHNLLPAIPRRKA